MLLVVFMPILHFSFSFNLFIRSFHLYISKIIEKTNSNYTASCCPDSCPSYELLPFLTHLFLKFSKVVCLLLHTTSFRIITCSRESVEEWFKPILCCSIRKCKIITLWNMLNPWLGLFYSVTICSVITFLFYRSIKINQLSINVNSFSSFS